ncbi:chalcone isomerase family protein [Undibacterium sp. RuTC16W]|uniref:chalcone isomerase family protein n=1 Tax=Undibacterium sp. RuTC16W TaxID=3413048 RepID=UPI003BF16784
MMTSFSLRIFSGIASLSLCLAVLPCHAVEIQQIKIANQVTLGSKELVLNGTGVRSVLFAKAYVAALYVPAKTDNPAQVIASGPRKMVLHILRDIDVNELAAAMLKGMRKNNSQKDLADVTMQMASFGQVFGTIPMVKNGDTITFDYVPGIGSSAYVNKTQLGTVLQGDQFARVFFRIWLGDQPVQDTLKRELLGLPAYVTPDKTYN